MVLPGLATEELPGRLGPECRRREGLAGFQVQLFEFRRIPTNKEELVNPLRRVGRQNTFAGRLCLAQECRRDGGLVRTGVHAAIIPHRQRRAESSIL